MPRDHNHLSTTQLLYWKYAIGLEARAAKLGQSNPFPQRVRAFAATEMGLESYASFADVLTTIQVELNVRHGMEGAAPTG